MLSPQEIQIAEYGKANGKSRQDVIAALEKYRSTQPQQQAPVAPEREETGFGSRVVEQVKEAGGDIAESVGRGAELMQEGKPLQGALRSGLGAAGGAARAIFSPVTAALAPIFQKGIEASGITDNEKVQETLGSLSEWAEAHPDAAANLQNVTDVALLGGAGAGARAATPAIKAGIKGTQEAAKAGISKVAPAIQATKEATTGVASYITRLPGRIKTNVGAAIEAEQAIAKLPSQTAQTAVRDGVKIADVKTVQKLPKEFNSQYKKLVGAVQKFAKGETKQNPLEVVGKPIVNRLKQLDKARQRVGAKLGAAAEKLGTVTRQEMTESAIASLKKVPGLNGLTVSSKGILNFKGTTLAELSSSAKKDIQIAFSKAIKGGSGKDKHLFRQELFEILGGRKKSLTNMTGTHERALEALRKGIADVLETKNSTYKALNQEFAKIVSPMNDFKKLMKGVEGAPDDILEASAALLARRLTSMAPTGVKIKNLLRQLDEATKIKGKSQLNTESLQDLYNILNDYYVIAPKTGLQGVLGAGTKGGIRGVSEVVVGATKKLAGETEIVSQKALEALLKEVLR